MKTIDVSPFIKALPPVIGEANQEEILTSLLPILEVKCPFSKLDRIGKALFAVTEAACLFSLLDKIAATRTMGSFPIIGRVLFHQISRDVTSAFCQSRKFIIQGDVWFACDIIAERSLGLGLVQNFEAAVPVLRKFLQDPNPWVRRSVGVAVHVFSKRERQDPCKTNRLLKLLEPALETTQRDVIKGIGWGLKTIGRYHPHRMETYLTHHLSSGKKLTALMLRKALTYLDKEVEDRIRVHAKKLHT